MKTFLLLFCSFILLSSFTPTKNPGAITTNNNKTERIIIRLYPNPSSDGNVTVCSMAQEKLDFYLFDLDGKMISQLTLKNKEKQTISGLKKGTYMYTILDRDETVEAGKIIVKN